jgi:diketogulonate reductase-like aldo/keto reductase
LEAYSPLGTGKVFTLPLLQDLSRKYKKTVAQVCLRWSLQMGFLPLPKSVTASRIQENTDVFDFELEMDDVARISGVTDFVKRQLDPDTADF